MVGVTVKAPVPLHSPNCMASLGYLQFRPVVRPPGPVPPLLPVHIPPEHTMGHQIHPPVMPNLERPDKLRQANRLAFVISSETIRVYCPGFLGLLAKQVLWFPLTDEGRAGWTEENYLWAWDQARWLFYSLSCGSLEEKLALGVLHNVEFAMRGNGLKPPNIVNGVMEQKRPPEYKPPTNPPDAQPVGKGTGNGIQGRIR